MTNSIFSHVDISIKTSQRADKSMKHQKKAQVDTIKTFLGDNGFVSNFKIMQQVHGNDVVYVSQDSETITSGTDGIISQDNVTLGVFTADCLPVLLYDPVIKTIGAVHAGYRGVYNEVVLSAIQEFEKLGAHKNDILIGVGPAIGSCCYNVDEQRAQMFIKKFGDGVIISRDGIFFLNLKKALALQLERYGIPSKNINVQNVCTQCEHEQYFSYRADSDETFGEMISVIGFT